MPLTWCALIQVGIDRRTKPWAYVASNVQDLYRLGRDGETLEYLLSAAPERAIRMVQSGYVAKPRAYLATAIRNAKVRTERRTHRRRTEADTSNPDCQTAGYLGKPEDKHDGNIKSDHSSRRLTGTAVRGTRTSRSTPAQPTPQFPERCST